MIKREAYLKKIRPFMGTDLIKVFTGIRRCGKSVMLELIKEELTASGADSAGFISLNFEDMHNAHLRTAETLHAEIEKRASGIQGRLSLFFDEIQEVEEWERAVNSFRVEFDCDIYITGSNANLLSGELATYLSGRYVEFKIYPFSFAEFIELYRTRFPEADTAQCFKRYLTAGGMPYLSILNYDDLPCRQYLLDMYNSVLVKDIIKRNNIRDVDLLERIINYVTSNIGTTFSAISISKFLKSQMRSVSLETVLSYLKASTDACLFCKVKRNDLKGKRLLTTHEKYYLADHGIREAVFEDNLQQINLVMENMVCLELLRRGYNVTVGKFGEQEIDFIGQKGSSKVYVQVSYMLSSDETIKREFGVFYRIKDNHPKYVVTLDEFDMSRDGIRHKNIRDFLLQEQWD